MADKRSIKITDLDKVLTQDLTAYAKSVTEGIDKAASTAVRDLVRITRDTAPFNARAYHQHYMDLIASKKVESRATGSTYVWYVKPPGHRLTHLLVDGHETRDGGRTQADPFLENACDRVLPEFERNCKEVLKNGK